jgi:hypothetical protein
MPSFRFCLQPGHTPIPRRGAILASVPPGRPVYPRVFFLFLIPTILAAQPPLRSGVVNPKVEVRDHPGQTYALYVPSAYTPDRAWPVLYCLDPGARGAVPVERFAAAAEKAGVIVAGSNNSRNGPLPPAQEAINLMVADTHARLNLDDSRIFAAGLSGGARLALGWAMSAHIAGVVASSAGFPNISVPKQIGFRIFFTTGYDDFNHDEIYRASRELAGRKIPHRFAEFEGGHEWLPASLTADALAYLAGDIPPRPAEASRQAENEAAQFQRRYGEFENAATRDRPARLAALRRDAAGESDSSERRVARRVLGAVSTGAMEQMREALSQRRYPDAARLAEIAVLLRPENANAWYSLAVASAASGDTRRALEALDQALRHGFSDRARIESEPLLATVRRDRKYAVLMK